MFFRLGTNVESLAKIAPSSRNRAKYRYLKPQSKLIRTQHRRRYPEKKKKEGKEGDRGKREEKKEGII